MTITVSGQHNLPANARVWLFLIDSFGGYYIQNPAIDIVDDSQWEQQNVTPGTGIRTLVAIHVNSQGHERLLAWVKAKRWGRISKDEITALPGYAELDRLRVYTPD